MQAPTSPVNVPSDAFYGQQSTNEVSESAFEYLIGEILSMNYAKSEEEKNMPDTIDNEFIKSQRLDEIGFNVGYRCVSCLYIA